jgi:hypothetical protein
LRTHQKWCALVKVEVVAGRRRGGKWPLLHAAAERQRAGERAAKGRECAAKVAGWEGVIALGGEGAKGKETAGDKEVAAFTRNVLLPLVTIAAVIDLPSSEAAQGESTQGARLCRRQVVQQGIKAAIA